MNSTVKQFKDYTTKLLGMALTDREVTLPPDNFSWKALYLFASKHKLVSLIYFAILKLPKDIQDSIPNYSDFLKSWKQELFFDANRQAESITISEKLSANGIDHVFLKGYVTKYLYPDTSMRSMGDMDILYRTDLEDVALVEIMESLGYKQINHTPKDDTFINPQNSTCIELHRALVDKGYEREYNYLESIWDKLTPKSSHEYEMSKEDFYIYHIIHMAKHIQHSGIGILPFIDLWLYVSNYDLNRDYLDREFSSLELLSFEKYARLLAFRWFGDKDSVGVFNWNSGNEECISSISGNYNLCTDSSDNEILNLLSDFIFKSGAYGTETQMEINTIANNNSDYSNALLRRLFPDKTTMVNYYGDIINKRPYLIPFYWVYLNFSRLRSKDISFTKKKRIISSISKEQVDTTKTLLSALFEE